jgi:5-methylcytosine-specific restriction enzyme subunit McrC
VSSDLHRRWIELIAAFEDVADVAPLPGELDRLVFDRQGARYRRAMEWVRWILALLSPALRAGSASAPAFLFDMNRVFELAVENVLRRRIEAGGIELHAQETGRHLARLQVGAGGRAYGLKPDLIVRRGRAVRLIADAKWKRVEVTPSGYLKPARSDVYQMHAYAAAFGVDRLALIYPAHRGTAGAATTAFALPSHGGGEPTLAVACIDVHDDDLPIVNGSDAFTFLGAPRLSA